MSIAAGVLSIVSVSQNGDSLSSTAASGGTAPYTYQWYRSTVSGFSPGAGNLIAGATSLALSDSGLIPNTVYYYVVKATDSVSASANSAQLTVTTSVPTQSQNAFSQSAQLGMLDLRFDPDTISVQIDSSQATPLFAGAAVKVVNSVGGIPSVVGCSANSDDVFGFILFDIKTIQFVAGVAAEVSQSQNVMYLYATTAISRGTRVTLDLTTNGGVGALVGASGADIVGYAFDQAAAPGALIRVKLFNPSFQKA